MKGMVKSADTGVVDKNIETPEGAVDAGGGVFELMKDGDVAGDDFGLAAFIENGLSGRVERGLRASEENGGSAELSQFAGDGGADAAACTGDGGHLAGKWVCGVHTINEFIRAKIEFQDADGWCGDEKSTRTSTAIYYGILTTK